MLEQFATYFAAPPFHLVGQVYAVLTATAFIWGTLLSIWLAQSFWLEYIRADFIRKNFDFILLEIKLPRIIEKTPVAMELVLQALYQNKPLDWYDVWWKGEVKPWFSLEIVSIEGGVKFLIRTPARYKRVVEAHIYAQYPDIEVIEVKDYVSLAPYIHEKENWSLWGTEFKLLKPDPYPIKTYVDYGLDQTMTPEEMKSDPITSLIEFLGHIGRGQQIWMQFLVQANSNRYKTPGKLFARHGWADEGKLVIKKIQEKFSGDFGVFKATKRESEVIYAIERSLGKVGFDCGIRVLYIAKNEFYDSTVRSGLIGIFGQYSSQDLNGFGPKYYTSISHPWEDFRGIRLKLKKKRLFDAYVRRSCFHAPYKRKPFVLNAEELATIYHFPGGVAETPTLSRTESRKGEPPANLPV